MDLQGETLACDEDQRRHPVRWSAVVAVAAVAGFALRIGSTEAPPDLSPATGAGGAAHGLFTVVHPRPPVPPPGCFTTADMAARMLLDDDAPGCVRAYRATLDAISGFTTPRAPLHPDTVRARTKRLQSSRGCVQVCESTGADRP